MKPAVPSTPPRLTCNIGSDNIIYLEMEGSLAAPFLPEFEAWAKQVREAMVKVSALNDKRVLTLIQAANPISIDKAGMKALGELMKFNKNYATKTAVYGLGAFGRTIVHSVIVMTHRYSMKVFDTRDDAMKWLTLDDGGATDPISIEPPPL